MQISYTKQFLRKMIAPANLAKQNKVNSQTQRKEHSKDQGQEHRFKCSLANHMNKSSLYVATLCLGIILASCGTRIINDSNEGEGIVGSNEAGSGIEESGREIPVLIAKMDTVFKESTESSIRLDSDSKCQIDSGTKILVSSLELDGSHAKVKLARGYEIPNCKLSTGFVFTAHFSGIPENLFAQPTRALLSTIALAEGTNERYDLIFTFKTFNSFADHPRRIFCSGGLCSNAAGRYQFLDSTWDETRSAAGLSDFSPANQDRGAIYRIQTFRGVTEHGNALGRAAFERMIYKLNNEWASLPGSQYGQPTKSMNVLWNHYVAKL